MGQAPRAGRWRLEVLIEDLHHQDRKRCLAAATNGGIQAMARKSNKKKKKKKKGARLRTGCNMATVVDAAKQKHIYLFLVGGRSFLCPRHVLFSPSQYRLLSSAPRAPIHHHGELDDPTGVTWERGGGHSSCGS